ncbi:MAG: ATP-dependent protease subunit HslV [Paenibacillaceae bacterium]|nr:ATP-dependent protease subunit HslV [Paenibacillaceae bacterium]
MNTMHATTIVAVLRDGQTAMAGDGQVTFGQQMILKHTAKKLRRLYHGRVLAGFAGSVADAITLFDAFEGKLEQHDGNIQRAAIELTKQWRGDRILRRLEAMMIVVDARHMLVLSGTGEVIQPDDGVIAIGSGAPYALAAARALRLHAQMDARTIAETALRIASDLCVYTNDAIVVETIEGGV